MTLDEIRDALAEMDEWTYLKGTDYVDPCWVKKGHKGTSHPHPPTLDGADAAVPDGYEWERTGGKWIAWEHEESFGRPINVPDTGNKIADLYALALACRKAMEEQR